MKCIPVIVFFVVSLCSNCQEPVDKKAVYDILRTHNLSDPTRFAPAKKAFQNFIVSNPTSNYRLIAMFFLAEIAKQQGKTDSALRLYNDLLAIPVPDSADEMNCKNRSAKRLADFYITMNDFCTAINYLDLARLSYSPRFSCGNAYAEGNMEMKTLYASCYVGQGEPQKAIDSLAPYMFANHFASNSKLLTKLYDTYLKVYTKETIKNEFLNLENILTIKRKTFYTYSYLQPTIKFFFCEIDVPAFDLELDKLTDQQQRQKCIDYIKRSEMYKLATTN